MKSETFLVQKLNEETRSLFVSFGETMKGAMSALYTKVAQIMPNADPVLIENVDEIPITVEQQT